MKQRAWKRHMTSLIKTAREHAAENSDRAYSRGGKVWVAYHMMQFASPRYIGSTSLIAYNRRPEDLVVVANSGAESEFRGIVDQVRGRIDGEKIVASTDNVVCWSDLSDNLELLEKHKGDVWFDSCLPCLDMFKLIFESAKRNREAVPLVICLGYLLRFQPVD